MTFPYSLHPPTSLFTICIDFFVCVLKMKEGSISFFYKKRDFFSHQSFFFVQARTCEITSLIDNANRFFPLCFLALPIYVCHKLQKNCIMLSAVWKIFFLCGIEIKYFQWFMIITLIRKEWNLLIKFLNFTQFWKVCYKEKLSYPWVAKKRLFNRKKNYRKNINATTFMYRVVVQHSTSFPSSEHSLSSSQAF